MRSFRRLAFVSTIATYILIFIGGLVRVSGAGLGCPDWPKCFGRWIPPLSRADIPVGVDPSSFNISLAWIEYGNRLAGMVTGLLVLATAILALIFFRKTARILYPTLLAALLTAFQGWQGGRVVASDLQSVMVSAHLLLALLIASLLLYVAQQTYFLDSVPEDQESSYPKQAPKWVLLLWLAGLVQIVLGTQVRTGIETVSAAYPLWSDLQWLGNVGLPYDAHMVFGTLLALFTWFVGISILKMSRHPSALVTGVVWSLAILVAFQMSMGFLLIAAGLKPLAQVFHLWLAGLYIGLTMVLYFGVRQTAASGSHARGIGRVAIPVVIGVAALAVLAFFVIDSAQASRSEIQVLGQVPEFQFVDQTGKPFGVEQLKGKISVVDFFFTNCQGPCPIMNGEFAEMYRKYAHSDKLQLVSFTVDPERDSLPALVAYARDFGVNDSRWLFVRGEAGAISSLCEKGFMLSGELPGMHSTKFVLVDDRARIRGYYDYDDAAQLKLLRAHIQQLVRELP